MDRRVPRTPLERVQLWERGFPGTALVHIDCHDVRALSAWWAVALGWRPIYESDDEVVLVPAHVDEQTARSMPWAQVPPGLVFGTVPEAKTVKNRLHLDLAPHTSDDRDAGIARLLAMGATRVDVG
jgi:hypothetical protein